MLEIDNIDYTIQTRVFLLTFTIASMGWYFFFY